MGPSLPDYLARLFVPKMVKNGYNSYFLIWRQIWVSLTQMVLLTLTRASGQHKKTSAQTQLKSTRKSDPAKEHAKKKTFNHF
jgi:hypothetical protein